MDAADYQAKISSAMKEASERGGITISSVLRVEPDSDTGEDYSQPRVINVIEITRKDPKLNIADRSIAMVGILLGYNALIKREAELIGIPAEKLFTEIHKLAGLSTTCEPDMRSLDDDG